jgi:bifunctional UDP-N-acetylglucosamine pyrophosphorylase/glucosamine-1-phosphate N-acetyltransferase
MKSDLTKVMHPILGRPMIEWVVRAALDAGCKHVTVIVGHQRDQVREHLEGQFPGQVGFAVQEEQLGTGHAVWSAVDQLRDGPNRTLILSGDVPNMQPESLEAFVEAVGDAKLGVMTAVLEDAAKYGRIIRSGDNVAAIVEWADATEEQREVREINTGFYVADTAFLCDELDRLCSSEPDNAQGEYYLTDLVAVAADLDDAVAWTLEDHDQMQGVNTRAHLAAATRWARRRINQHWMDAGVTMLDPTTTHIDADVHLDYDVTLHPGVELRGETRVGRGTTVGNSSVIENSEVGELVNILPFCHLEDARVEAEAKLGPMCHLRPGADIGPEAKVGNFVEVKKSRLDRGAKANHHAYIGDGFVGAGANIGAGTIFCNYDGEHKHRTEIGEGVFIGSNSALVAPVRIEDGAYVGAGSVITNDVPGDSLAVARGRQRNIEGWARRKREE